MEKRVASLLLVLSVAGLFAAATAAGSDDVDTIRLPSDGNGNVNGDRPWECCDKARCTRSQPPRCQCLDRKQCPETCEECVGFPHGGGEACLDWYTGPPPPKCNKHKQNPAVLVHGVGKKGDDERPPWKCCDRAVPGPSTKLTPVWYCLDKFDHCDCENCAKVKDSDSYFCLDEYKGRDPGPSCSHNG